MRIRFVLIGLGLPFLLALGLAWAWPQDYGKAPWDNHFSILLPSFATADSAGDLFVVDNSLNRLRKLRRDGSLVFELTGGSRQPGQLFFPVELAVDPQGYLYVLNQVMREEGFFTEREEVVRFDPDGRFVQVVGSRTYQKSEETNTLVNRGNFLGLRATMDSVSWFELNEDSVNLTTVRYDNWRPESKPVLAIAHARQLVASLVQVDDSTVAYVTKQGRIFQKTDDRPAILLYDSEVDSGDTSLSVPWWLGLDARQHLLFSDLARRQINQINGNKLSTLLSTVQLAAFNHDRSPYIYYQFSVALDGSLVTVNDNAVVLLSPDGEVERVVTGGDYTLSQLIFRGLFWIGLACGVGFGLSSAVWAYDRLLRNRLTLIIKQLLILIPLVAGLLGLTIWFFLSHFSANTETQALQNIAQSIQLIAQKIDTDRLDRIQHLSDYLNADYQFIRNQLHSALNNNQDPWNNRFYFALHRFHDNSIYTTMYLNDGVTIFHPFNYLNDPANLYIRASQGKIVTDKIPDAFGNWVLGVGPIYAPDGHLAGLLEIGRDLYGFQKETNRLLAALIPTAVGGGLAILAVFAGLTWLFFGPLRSLRRSVTQVARGEITPPSAIRGSDEVADLTLGFNKLTTFIQCYSDEVLNLTRLGDSARPLTVLYLTRSIPEREFPHLDPSEQFAHLTEFYDLVLPELRSQQGFVQVFFDTSLVVLFPSGPLAALKAAIQITEKVWSRLKTSISIHSFAGKTDLSLHSEALPKALEGLTKTFDAAIMVTDTARAGLPVTTDFVFRLLGPQTLPGIAEQPTLFEVLNGSPDDVKARKLRSRQNLEAGIGLYLAEDFSSCQNELSKALVLNSIDAPARFYMNCCRQALAKPLSKELF